MWDLLYAARLKADLARQPRHQNKYEELQQLFDSHGFEDPYNGHDYANNEWREVSRDASFLESCCGYQAFSDSVGAGFLYRATSFSNLLRYTSPGLLGRFASEDNKWAMVQRSQSRTGDWMVLSDFLSGKVTGPRGFTWWTPHDLSLNVFKACHQIGLPDDWIATRVVILRRPVVPNRSPIGYVPTILDGFDSPIFCATRDSALPKFGTCINLEASPLAIGHSEIISQPEDVSNISFVALSETRRFSSQDRIELDSLLSDLLRFYESLETGV
jgi:hypothetical protein